MPQVEDHLAHYGVPGMKWGKRKVAAAKERNASIDDARARQTLRKAEIRSLTAQRINARTSKGKAHIDRQLADKKFEIDNNPDSRAAKQLKTGEKVMKGVKIAAILGMSVVGLGTAASIVNSELSRMENEGKGEELTKAWVGENGSHKIKTPNDPEAVGRALGMKIKYDLERGR